MSAERTWKDWAAYWGACPPLGPLLREAHPGAWLRIHSLPGAKRYATSASEWDELVMRHNTVASAVLGPEAPCLFIRPSWKLAPEPEGAWTRLARDASWSDEMVPDWFHVMQAPWTAGAYDALLRDVADDRSRLVVTSHVTGSVYSPYDGGADLFFTSPSARRDLAERFAEWRAWDVAGV